MKTFDVAIVGSGFAGSILARLLALQGRSVCLIEKGEHPRFALGESSTPLAALCLERLARSYGLEDLYNLAAYGRWRQHLDHLGCGLKRGFTFFRHRRGEAFTNSAANESRLLVAASPDEEVADCHWLRRELDHHLLLQAQGAGVEVRQRTKILGVEVREGVWSLQARGAEGETEIPARFLVDATGRGGLAVASGLARSRRLDSSRPASLLFCHLRGARPFAEVARGEGAVVTDGPYEDDRAAVHHLLAQGWMYQLPFDDGVVSAGFVGAEDEETEGLPPGEAWRKLLARYPSLERQLRGVELLRPVERIPEIRHRLDRAGGIARGGLGRSGTSEETRGRIRSGRPGPGPGWVALPHAYGFADPLFSTGIAWSLMAVERLAESFRASAPGFPGTEELESYGASLETEADQVEDLVEAAYAALPDFELFTSVTFLYFAAVSFQELRQRLVVGEPGVDPERVPDREPDCGSDPGSGRSRDLGPGSGLDPGRSRGRGTDAGFLGARDPVSRDFIQEGRRRLEALRANHGKEIPAPERQAFTGWVREAVAPRNVVGLGDPVRRNLYPVDLEVLRQRADLLGLDGKAFEEALPRLRSAESWKRIQERG